MCVLVTQFSAYEVFAKQKETSFYTVSVLLRLRSFPFADAKTV